jgi:hypothetical protein
MNVIKTTIKGLVISLLFLYGMFCCFGGWAFLPTPYNILSVIPLILFVSHEVGKITRNQNEIYNNH